MKTYILKKVKGPMSILDPRWEKVTPALLDEVWQDIHPSPYRTVARLVHSDEGLTLRMSTDEWPLRAEHTLENSMICEDSCLEFFLTPNEEETKFLNFEINPFAVPHVGLGVDRHGRRMIDLPPDCRVETWITRGQWQLLIFVPYSFLRTYFGSVSDTMKGNFYKCGDMTVRPHYSMWSRVEGFDYHQPQYFGRFLRSDEEIL